MARRILLALFPLILLATPAAASAEGGSGGGKDVGQYVDLVPVGLPIIVRSQLVNYVFVYVRLNLTGSANVSRWREKEPYFRDALVRAGHRTPFTLAADYQKIDTVALTASLMRDASAITGPNVIKSVVVTSQAPRGRARIPREAAEGAP